MPAQAADRELIHDFVRDVGGVAMIKPLDGAGGMGVIQIKSGDKTARAIVDMLTHEGKHFVMVQEYIPAVTLGDKRILVLDPAQGHAVAPMPGTNEPTVERKYYETPLKVLVPPGTLTKPSGIEASGGLAFVTDAQSSTIYA